MERQNKKLAEKMQKDETRRINDMVERCHKWDPRIIAYKEQLKNAKKAGKQVLIPHPNPKPKSTNF